MDLESCNTETEILITTVGKITKRRCDNRWNDTHTCSGGQRLTSCCSWLAIRRCMSAYRREIQQDREKWRESVKVWLSRGMLLQNLERFVKQTQLLQYTHTWLTIVATRRLSRSSSWETLLTIMSPLVCSLNSVYACSADATFPMYLDISAFKSLIAFSFAVAYSQKAKFSILLQNVLLHGQYLPIIILFHNIKVKNSNWITSVEAFLASRVFNLLL